MKIPPWTEPSPFFYAWCDEANRVDAFSAALTSLVAGGTLDLHMSLLPLQEAISTAEAAATLRVHLARNLLANASFQVALTSARTLPFSSTCHTEESERRRPTGPLHMWPSERRQLLPVKLSVAEHAPQSPELEAAIACLLVQPDVEDLLLRFCTSPAIATGGYAERPGWKAPLEMAGTYQADLATIARDLSLSWVHLHEAEPVERAAGLPLDALRARVEAAPVGARIPIATHAHRLGEQYAWIDRDDEPKQRHIEPVRQPRKARPGDDEMTREQILAAISTPPETLLQALEAAAAAPDDEWQSVEPLTREVMRATMEDDTPTRQVDVNTRSHVDFLRQHAPYRVRRLPNGGVILATHPYRILWPLWADALALLGIREAS